MSTLLRDTNPQGANCPSVFVALRQLDSGSPECPDISTIQTRMKVSSTFHPFSFYAVVLMFLKFLLRALRCWPTGWTCPTGRWAASCAGGSRQTLFASQLIRLRRSLLLLLHEPAALPLKLPLPGSSRPGQSLLRTVNKWTAHRGHGGRSSCLTLTVSDAPRGSESKLGRLRFIGPFCRHQHIVLNWG